MKKPTMRKIRNLILLTIVTLGLITETAVFQNTTASDNGGDTFIQIADSDGTASQQTRAAAQPNDGTASQNNFRQLKNLLNI